MIDKDFIISLKLYNNGLHLHQISDKGNADIYKAYNDAGGLHQESPRDTHYVMDGAYIIFIGNKHELLGFLNSSF
jgi:hypothetical protein|tara:strand:+ start:517 stop:741 length:225 start_codon:yes stop_codon:yes gene_type:complete